MKTILIAVALLLIASSDTYAITITEVEPNNSIERAQNVDEFISLQFDPIVSLSATIPHVTIASLDGDNTRDIYRFTSAGGTIIVDIDRSGGDFDSIITLSSFAPGAIGGVSDDDVLDPGSTNPLDSFLQINNEPPGVYYVDVRRIIAGVVPPGQSYLLHISTRIIPEPGVLWLLVIGFLPVIRMKAS